MKDIYLDIFSKKATAYTAYRPTYSEELFTHLARKGILRGDSVCLDAGAGTGKFTEHLLKLVGRVYALEPNPSMRAECEKNLAFYPNLTVVDGTAECTGLTEGSFDFICCAQAFHWIDADEFKKECIRVGKSSGYVLLAYNRKMPGIPIEIDRQKIVSRYRAIKDEYDCDWEIRERAISRFFGGRLERLCYENDLAENLEHFLGRTLSASHALTPDDPRFHRYCEDLENYFNKYSCDGLIRIPNETLAYIGRISDLTE